MKSLHWIIVAVSVAGIAFPAATQAAKADGNKAKLIAKYDKDGNGIIDGKEMEAFRADLAKKKIADWKKFDTDKNGELSDKEIKAIKAGAVAGTSKEKKQEKKQGKEQEKQQEAKDADTDE